MVAADRRHGASTLKARRRAVKPLHDRSAAWLVRAGLFDGTTANPRLLDGAEIGSLRRRALATVARSRHDARVNSWALVVGASGAARRSLVDRLARRLAERGLVVAGAVQEAVIEGGERAGYVARRLGGDERCPIARHSTAAPGPSEEAYCSFLFDATGFSAARRWLAEDGARADVLFIDEVSRFEAAGRGHHDAIRAALAGRALPILSVRADQLFAVIERFDLDEPVASLDAARIDDAAEAAFVEAAHALVKTRPLL